MPVTQVVHGGGSSPTLRRRVYYTGTDTLEEGYAMCYNFDAIDRSAENISLATGTQGADDECPARHIQVEKPSPYNSQWFAGVVTGKHSGFTGPGYIEINMPGSTCNIYCSANVDHATETTKYTTTGTGLNTGQIVTFSTNAYDFQYQGLPGEGSACVLQDVDRSSTSGLVMAKLMTGRPSGGVTTLTSLNSSNLLYSGATFSLASSLVTGSLPPVPHGVFQVNWSLDAGDVTHLVKGAQGIYEGQTKVYRLLHAVDNDWNITFSTYRLHSATGSAVVGTLIGSLDAAGEEVICEWDGTAWNVKTNVAYATIF
ncbi:MAG: hypothetical protein ACYSTZ_00100 [Planctomycetota bacterium]|jgi:hypothetical protein